MSYYTLVQACLTLSAPGNITTQIELQKNLREISRSLNKHYSGGHKGFVPLSCENMGIVNAHEHHVLLKFPNSIFPSPLG